MNLNQSSMHNQQSNLDEHKLCNRHVRLLSQSPSCFLQSEEGFERINKSPLDTKHRQLAIRKRNSVFVGGSKMTDGNTKASNFDSIRGQSTDVASYHNLNTYLPSSREKPRLQVLENFKDINRLLRKNFMKKFKEPDEDDSAHQMTEIMRKF